MPQGSAELVVPGDPARVFAFLADPRNAQAWFSDAPFDEPPEGDVRAGTSWVLARTEETRHPMPMAVRAYEPPERFVWETRNERVRTNWTWTVTCAPASESARAEAGIPSPATVLRLAIRLRPGVFDTLLALLLSRTLRQTLAARAQRTLERARAALGTRSGASRSGGTSASPTAGPRSGQQRRRRRGR
jgi:uncharacterized protein YndB with AHSA1/START domain